MSGPFPFGDVMRKLQLFPWVIGLLCSPLAAQQRHTITHEDVFLMKRVGSPAISPDGSWIVFSVTEPSYTEGEQVSDLWLVPTDGSAEPRRLTNSKGGEGGVDWSPDSRRIAFTARREGDDQAQVYVLDLASGGEAQRITSLSTGASSPLWRPDGKAILFSRMSYPGATPDGSGVVFAATTNRTDWAHGDVVQALWLVSAVGGEPQRVTQGKDDYDGPQFSPDGKTLYAVMTPTNEHTFNNRRVVAWSWPRTAAAAPRAVTGGADHSVGSYTIAPDNRALFFLAEDAGHQRLFRAPATGGKEQEVGSMTSGTFGALQVAAATTGPAFKIAAVWESATNPPEIARVDPVTGRWTPLTKFNADRAATIDWQPLREFWFTSSRGKRIHSFYALPPGFDSTRTYPLFVLIDRKSTRLNSSHLGISYAVFCLKKKKKKEVSSHRRKQSQL